MNAPRAQASLAHERFFSELRAREFARLDEAGHAYLDYTGSGLYGASQLRWHADWLGCRVLGNPHSDNPASLESHHEVECVKERVMAFFGADPERWELVFTGNATGAMKLVGEAFPFAPGSRFVMAMDNHNSVGGMREYARRAGAAVSYLPLDGELRLDAPLDHLGHAGDGPSLLAYPAQSNFSGVKHGAELVAAARERGFRVYWDTAAYAPTNPLDLGAAGPDFACISFYKLFGYPTGLGALLARREAMAELERPWYAGGTVDYVSLRSERVQMRRGGGAFEDGTPDFLGIAALTPGLDILEGVGMARLRERIASLTGRLLDELAALGDRVEFYGPADTRERGGTVAFNLRDDEGAVIPFEEVEAAGQDEGVSIRGGCFCNPGAGEIALGIAPDEMARCLDETADDFSMARLRACLGEGRAVGALRASLGMASSEGDIEALGRLLRRILAR